MRVPVVLTAVLATTSAACLEDIAETDIDWRDTAGNGPRPQSTCCSLVCIIRGAHGRNDSFPAR